MTVIPTKSAKKLQKSTVKTAKKPILREKCAPTAPTNKPENARKSASTQILTLPIGEIRPYEKNPRKNENAVKYVKESIRQFGFKVPIVIDSNRVIVCGHTRLLAAKSLGLTEVPCIMADDLTDDQIKAFRLADNKVGEFAEWDLDLLGDELDAIADASDIDMGDFGFDLSDDDEEMEVVEDEVPEEVEPVCKKGEVWQLGEHRLMCGDSTDADAVAKLMNGEKADGVLTDPPFGNDLGYGRGQLGERYIANDSDTKVLSSFFAPLDSVLKNNTHCLVWIQWRTFSTLEKAFEKYKLRTVVIWDKMQPGLSGGGFAEQYEMMCVFIKGHATQNEYCGNVWQISREHDKRSESEHPHKKPIALLGKALNLCSHEGDIILDLFGGSGSTMIACEQLGRKCRMMELDPHYCDVIIARWEQFTGKKAVKMEE